MQFRLRNQRIWLGIMLLVLLQAVRCTSPNEHLEDLDGHINEAVREYTMKRCDWIQRETGISVRFIVTDDSVRMATLTEANPDNQFRIIVKPSSHLVGPVRNRMYEYDWIASRKSICPKWMKKEFLPGCSETDSALIKCVNHLVCFYYESYLNPKTHTEIIEVVDFLDTVHSRTTLLSPVKFSDTAQVVLISGDTLSLSYFMVQESGFKGQILPDAFNGKRLVVRRTSPKDAQFLEWHEPYLD